MAAIDDVIKEFVKNRVGGVIVNTSEGDILYKDSRIVLSSKGEETWLRKRPLMDGRKTWEFADSEAERYYRVETAVVESKGESYQCHLFTDVSDYASLFQDISDYSELITDMSDFQKNILSRLSQEYDSFLPDLTQFCKATDSVLYMEEKGTSFIRRSSFNDGLTRRRIKCSKEIEDLFRMRRFGFTDGYYCFLSECTQNQRYALFLRRGSEFNEEYFRDVSVYNVIRLYIENGVLREKIRYESEHDRLTGLYNKGKYLSLREQDFHHPESAAVFYFDVNNLKKVNDTLGHEAGDHLIIQSAQSIKNIMTENVYAFRMGGDEFLMIAQNISENEASALKKSWEESLAKINQTSKEEPITIACGLEYSAAPCDFDAMIASADEKMYQNKRELKEKLGLSERS